MGDRVSVWVDGWGGNGWPHYVTKQLFSVRWCCSAPLVSDKEVILTSISRQEAVRKCMSNLS